MLRRAFCLRGDGYVLADVFTLAWQILIDASIEYGRWSSPEQNSPFALGTYLIPMISWRLTCKSDRVVLLFCQMSSLPLSCRKSCPSRAATSAQSIYQTIDTVSGFARAVSLLACVSAALRFIHVSQNENSLRISAHSYLEIVCRTSNAAHNKEGVSYA